MLRFLFFYSHLKMTSERSKRCDLLACIFITKSISKKLLIIIHRSFPNEWIIMLHGHGQLKATGNSTPEFNLQYMAELNEISRMQRHFTDVHCMQYDL